MRPGWTPIEIEDEDIKVLGLNECSHLSEIKMNNGSILWL